MNVNSLNRRVAVKEGTVTMKSIAENKRAQNVEKGLSEIKSTFLTKIPAFQAPPPPRQRNAGFGSLAAGTFGKPNPNAFKNLSGKSEQAHVAAQGITQEKEELFSKDLLEKDDLYTVEDTVSEEANAIFSFGDKNTNTKKSNTQTSGSFGKKPAAKDPVIAPVPVAVDNRPPIQEAKPATTAQLDFFSDVTTQKPIISNDIFNFSVPAANAPAANAPAFDPFANVNYNPSTVTNNIPAKPPVKKDPFDFNFF